MNEWLKIALPILLTAMLSIMYGIFERVTRIEETQIASRVYVYRIEQLELKVKVMEKRNVE